MISAAPVIEPEPTVVPAAVAPPAIEAETKPASEAAPPLSSVGAAAVTPAPRAAEPIIPLVHAPDDPGPDVIEESEAAEQPQPKGWRKIFG